MLQLTKNLSQHQRYEHNAINKKKTLQSMISILPLQHTKLKNVC